MAKVKNNPNAKLPPVLDTAEFRRRVVGAYNSGTAELSLAADQDVARSLVPPGPTRHEPNRRDQPDLG